MSGTYPDILTPKEQRFPILLIVMTGDYYNFGDIYKAMVAELGLSDELKKGFPYFGDDNSTAGHGGKVFYKYCNNACKYLADLGLLERKGEFHQEMVYKITPLGRAVVERNLRDINKKSVERVRREIRHE